MTRAADNEAFARHAQARLGVLGYYSGAQDGWAGPRTRAAFDAALVGKGAAEPAQIPAFRSPPQASVAERFGPAGGLDCTAGRCELPFPFVIAWDHSQAITRFSCHSLIAPAMTSIFAHAAAHYGRQAFEALGLHQFGGCFNHRQMRGSAALSMHSWGIAVDLDPLRNGLKWGRDKARLGQPDAEPFWRIVEAHGAVSLGRARNYDWMHFQFATL
jgi:hypothetical protein